VIEHAPIVGYIAYTFYNPTLGLSSLTPLSFTNTQLLAVLAIFDTILDVFQDILGLES
jgi:hypothetical protein